MTSHAAHASPGPVAEVAQHGGSATTGWPVLDWFTNNGRYMDLRHCMDHDWLWIGITVGLDLVVAGGYVLIALHWWDNGRKMPDVPAARALRSMRNIFVLCGLCGYVFIPIKMVWPAWRLYDLFLVGLAWITWRYAWGARDLKVVYHEINRTQQLEVDLRASRKHLEVSKEEARRKSHFMNALSHDLRTPLNGLTLQTSLAEACLEVNDPEGAREAMGEVRRSAAATADLLNRLLEVGRLDWAEDPNEMTVFDLRAFAQNLHERFRGAAEAKGLTFESTADAAMVETDRVKLERILANLVDNALKFTDRGWVRLEATVRGDGLLVTVSDTGRGLSASVRQRLFDDFFQGDNEARDRNKGFGLGLAICRRLARQLGGDVTLQTPTDGEGRSSDPRMDNGHAPPPVEGGHAGEGVLPGSVAEGTRFALHLPGVVRSRGAAAELVRETVGTAGVRRR